MLGLGTIAKWFGFRNATLRNPTDWLKEFFGGDSTDSGVRVDGRAAMGYSTWWQATNVIAGDVGTLPLDLYVRTDEKSREKAKRHPAYRLMRRRPNPEMSASMFKKTLQAHATSWGNGYARIIRNGRNEPDSLWIRRPDKTTAHRDGNGLFYESQIETSPGVWETEITQPQDMLHIRGLGWDGTTGYSVINRARNSIGLGLAQEKYGNTFFKNNARPGGYIEAMPGTTQEAAAETLKGWNAKHKGAPNAHTMGMLVNAKYHQLGIPNDDAQFLESRQFQRGEIASWFNLPPHKVGDLENATFSNIEEQNRNYLNTTLMNWLVTWEDECWLKLLTEQQRVADSHFFEFNTSALLRGTLKERYDAYSIGVAGEWLSPNDVRAFENMDPRPGGDEYGNPNVKPAEAGEPGAEGIPGEDGAEGDAGEPGVNGRNGVDGRDGTNGHDGVQGEVGPRGETGVAGPRGEQGPKGEANTDSVKNVFAHELSKVIRTECRRVKHFASNASGFLSKVDDFYAGWHSKVLDKIAPAGGTEADAEAYCRESKDAILEVAGHATSATLETEIDNLVTDWPQRAEALANTSFGE